MLTKIKDFLSNRKKLKPQPSPVHSQRANGFQKAAPSDINFIFSLIVAEAGNGHFSSNFTLKFTHAGLTQQIKETITSGKCPIENKKIDSEMYVFIEDNQPIAFSWILKRKPAEIELYLLAVSPKNRSSGIGKKITQESIARFAIGTRFNVRLFRQSKTMLKIVKSIGFNFVASQARETRTLSFISK